MLLKTIEYYRILLDSVTVTLPQPFSSKPHDVMVPTVREFTFTPLWTMSRRLALTLAVLRLAGAEYDQI